MLDWKRYAESKAGNQGQKTGAGQSIGKQSLGVSVRLLCCIAT